MTSRQRHTLPRQIILKKSSEIEKVLKSGKRISGDLFNVYVCDAANTGVAFLISRRVGNAVKRNKMKRLFREVYRLNKKLFEGKQIIFSIRKYADDFHRIQKEVKQIKL